MTPFLSDDTDDLMLAARDTTIVTQATAANDTFPAPHGDQADEEAVFAGLAGRPAARRAKPPVRGVVRVRKPLTSGFLPGMGSDEDLEGLGAVKNASRLPRPTPRRLDRPMARPVRLARRTGRGFLPGLGEDAADADNIDGLGAAPRRLKPRIRTTRGAAASRPVIRRPSAGFLPGMGDDLGFLPGMNTGVVLAVGAVALYFLLRKR